MKTFSIHTHFNLQVSKITRLRSIVVRLLIAVELATTSISCVNELFIIPMDLVRFETSWYDWVGFACLYCSRKSELNVNANTKLDTVHIKYTHLLSASAPANNLLLIVPRPSIPFYLLISTCSLLPPWFWFELSSFQDTGQIKMNFGLATYTYLFYIPYALLLWKKKLSLNLNACKLNSCWLNFE